MDLAAVMDEVADKLRVIEGLRVFAYPADSVQPPAAVVTYPEEYTYDQTMRRGMDRITLPVVVLVGRASDRASRDQIAAYADGSSARSVKGAVEGSVGVAFDSARVTGAEFDVVMLNGVEYLAATFNIDIAGQGA